MGVFDLIDQDKVSTGITPARTQPSNFIDVVDASFQSTMDNFRSQSSDAVRDEIREQRDKKYKELTGRDIYDDAKSFLEDPNLLPVNRSIERLRDEKVIQAVDKLLDQSTKDGRFGTEQVLNSQGIAEAYKKKANDSLAKQQEVSSGATKVSAIAGGLVGGLAAMPFDVINMATLPFGAGASRSLLKTIFIEAGINAGAEVASQPFIAKWQNEVGHKYGFTEMAENVGMAAIFGGSVPVLGRGAKLSYEGGVHAFDTIKQTFKKYGQREAADSAEYMSRVAHLNHDIMQKFDEAFPEQHARAMKEANAAINEGRALDPDKTDTPIPKETDDPSMRSTVERFNEKVDTLADEVTERLRARGQIVDEANVNPIFREEKPQAPDIETQEKLQEMHESPEAVRAEQDTFDDIENFPDDKVIEFDSDGEPTKTVADYKKEIQEDSEYINIIRTCSL